MSKSVVIDNGSYSIKAGYVGDSKPGCIVRTEIRTNVVTSPIKYGIINDWYFMQILWKDIIKNKLKHNGGNIIMTQKIGNDSINKEKMISVMFETFNVDNYYCEYDSVLALYGAGKVTGMVGSVGYQKSFAIPIFEGSLVMECVRQINIGGWDQMKALKQLMTYNININQDKYYEDIIQTKCYVVNNCLHELNKWGRSYNIKEGTLFSLIHGYYGEHRHETIINDLIKNILSKYMEYNEVKEYRLPDGKTIKLEAELFQSSEIFFSNGFSVHFYKALNGLENETKNIMINNIILEGSPTLLNGFPERLSDDLQILYTKNNIKIPKSTKYAVWKGGAILGSLSSMNSLWINKNEYNDVGSSIVHRM